MLFFITMQIYAKCVQNKIKILNMSTIIDKKQIISAIKLHYGFNSDASFAKFLGIAPQTLSTWYARNTVDYEIIYSKCERINMNYLFSGEGEITIKQETNTTLPNYKELCEIIKIQAETIKSQQRTIDDAFNTAQRESKSA